jgi:hypothetical protein
MARLESVRVAPLEAERAVDHPPRGIELTLE